MHFGQCSHGRSCLPTLGLGGGIPLGFERDRLSTQRRFKDVEELDRHLLVSDGYQLKRVRLIRLALVRRIVANADGDRFIEFDGDEREWNPQRSVRRLDGGKLGN
jgi:hypothetical protein